MIPFVVGLALVGQASAAEPQYRQLRLVDGRVLTAEILATESDGLSLQLPQGRAKVAFDLLVDMLPTDGVAYRDQPDWSVWVVADDADRNALMGAFSALDGVRATPVGEGAPEAVAEASRECDDDVDCIARVSADSGWRWIVRAKRQGEKLRITSRTNSPTDATTFDVTATLANLDQQIYELLALERPYTPPPTVSVVDPVVVVDDPVPEVPKVPKSDRRKVLLQSFVPLPGYPSLRRGDTGGFLTAMGLVVPATAVWVGAVGQGSQSPGEFAALSVIGYYGATVLTSQVLGQRTLDKQQSAALSIGPTERGGPQILVGARF